MKLTILSVAYPFAPVRADTAGGAEHILRIIDSELKNRGHNSIVVACAGSDTAGRLIELPTVPGWIKPENQVALYEILRETINDVLHRSHIDLIHMHGIDFSSYIPLGEVPILVTIHLPVQWYPSKSFQSNQDRIFYNCVSASQQQSARGIHNLLPYVENGINLEDFMTNNLPLADRRNFVVAMGRICPEKAFHLAIDAAVEASISIVIAGELFPYESHHKYYTQKFLPRLNLEGVHYIGRVSTREKRILLQSARCLLVTSQVPETSSLVTMEAYACGTPVVAFPSGALSETVFGGRTGFLVTSVKEMAEAIKNIDSIDPQSCLELAISRFSAARMMDDYMQTYEQIIGIRHS